MKSGTPASRLSALALLVAAIGVFYAVVGWPLQRAYVQSSAAIGDGRLALERFAGSNARDSAVAGTLRDLSDSGLLVKAATDGSAAALLQTHLQQLIEQNAAQLVSIEALDGETQGAYRAVRVRAQFAIGHDGLGRVLHALEEGRPVVFLDNLSMNARSARAFGVERPLDIQVELTAFRALEN